MTDVSPIAHWMLAALPSLLIGAAFAAVFAIFLAGVHADARSRLGRYERRRRALARVEGWYPPGRLLPTSVVAARTRLAAERRHLERSGVLRRRPVARGA